MIKNTLLLSLLMAAGAVLAQTPTQEQLAAAKATADTVCFACHGTNGNEPLLPIYPRLAGQNADYLFKQLKDFQTGMMDPAAAVARHNATMAPMALVLPTDDDMRAMAEHFSGQQASNPTPIEDQAALELGKKIWLAGIAAKKIPACAGCHGPNGMGIMAQYPRLAGQQVEYAMLQMEAFQGFQGYLPDLDDPASPTYSPRMFAVRENDPASMMRDIASRMTTPEIKAVLHYASTLK